MGAETETPGSPIVTRRPATADDASFLQQVYASSRADEMALVPWSEAQKEAFLLQQFQAQDYHYHRYYPQAAFDVLLVEGTPAGRLYISRAEFTDEIRIMDIALLPEFRNRGIGTRLIQETMAEAASLGRGVRLHVEVFNPARRLYDRLGFRFVQEDGPYIQMEWLPAPDAVM